MCTRPAETSGFGNGLFLGSQDLILCTLGYGKTLWPGILVLPKRSKSQTMGQIFFIFLPAQITGIRLSLLLQETSLHLPDETIKYSNNFFLRLEVKIHYPHILGNKN